MVPGGRTHPSNLEKAKSNVRSYWRKLVSQQLWPGLPDANARSALHHLKPLPMLERDVKANVNARTSKTQILPPLQHSNLPPLGTNHYSEEITTLISFEARGISLAIYIRRMKFSSQILCWRDPLDNMLKEAVQGLTKICFPAGVLDQLGLDITESQTQEQGATDDGIVKMRELVQLEMVHKLAWLLAEQLGTPKKIETAITSVIVAKQH